MSSIKRQVLPAGLWVVATPIGNLGDLSPRARQAIEEADGVLCEDTRRTGKLLAALGLDQAFTKLVRIDEHASDRDIQRMVDRLLAGERLALVTDAGTPSISDPGARVVDAATKAGILVTPIPGPSAVATVLSVAGFQETAFIFRGFFPRSARERKAEMDRLHTVGFSAVWLWFESPERISEALATFPEAFVAAPAIAAKELTKLHEKFFRGNLGEVAQAVIAEIKAEGARGEWCFAIHWKVKEGTSSAAGAGNDSESARNLSESSEWVKALQCLADVRIPASEAARRVSEHFGVSRKVAYERALKIFGKKSSGGD